MNAKLVWGLSILLVALLSAPAGFAAQTDPTAVYGEELGSVSMPFDCDNSNRELAARGLALLHHMTYVGARAAFSALQEADPTCAMGYWGEAMSYIHPLWSDPPGEADFGRGESAADAAKARATNERERSYAEAVKAYYARGRNPAEKPNLAAFEEAWRKVYEKYPEDPEVSAFYALAHLATADPADKSYAVQKRTAEIAREVLNRIPDHPGGHHYIIHAYDYPPLAAEALGVARSYGAIAPAVPHALHMPSHIFTRLGLWPESIAMNRRSAEAALKHPADGQISMHYMHALDYLAYAYLQRGEDEKARKVLEELKALEGPYQTHVGSAYAFAAVPARLALERQRWRTAAGLEPRRPGDYSWETNPAMEAITWFARSVGAARGGDPNTAREVIEHLTTLEQRAAKTSNYWAKQVEIQRTAAEAWLAYAEGDTDRALKTMRRAAEMEAATEKHPVTPGEILPAHELLGDMLLETGRYEEAQANYLAALERSPNRFNSLYGAAHSAELAGDMEQAERHYRLLLEVAAEDSGRNRLKKARDFLAEK